jgi:Putative Ig domain
MKRVAWGVSVCLVLVTAAMLVSCGGGSSAGSSPPAPISVGASAANPTIDQSQSTTVMATVTNDSSNKGVTWSVTCDAAACGSVTPQSTDSGAPATYMAPANATKATITATSVADSTKTGSTSVTVNATPMLTPPPNNALPPVAVGVAYSFDLNKLLSGGTAPFTWSLVSGTLPAGLSLSSSGMITGTVTQAAAARQGISRSMIQPASLSATLLFSVQDSGNPPVTVTIKLTLTVSPAPLTITTTSLPGGTAGAVYGASGTGATVTASGGVSPYIWTISGLPSGLTFTSSTPSATISGSTCVVGNFTVKATVTDSESPTVSVSATFTLTIAPSTSLSITTTSPLPDVTLNTAYSTTIAATGGCAPYTWSLVAGSSLPVELNFTSGSPNATISGTPTVTGTYKFTVQVTDSESPARTVSATFLLTSTESPNVSCPTTVNLTLCGTYVVGLRGFNHAGGPIGLGADFVADNAGHIATSGKEDINSSTNSTGGQTFTITGGSYTMDVSGDGRGVVTLIYSDASSTSYRFALESANSATPGTDFDTSPIEEFDDSGTLASGVIVGPMGQSFVAAATVLGLSLEGANGSGQRVGLLGEIHLAGHVTVGCDGTSGSFVSVSGEDVIVNTQGKISNVTLSGACAQDADFNTSGRSTATATVSGGPPFANSTLHFVSYQLNFQTAFFLEMDPIGPNQPILSGTANAVTPVTSGITASFVDCSCIFTGHGTTDGTITGHSVATVIGFSTAAKGDSGTLTGIEDENAGGTLTLDAAVTGTYTVDDHSVGTITLNTPSGMRTIHFIIDGNVGSGNSASDNLDTLDESTSVGVGSSHGQLNSAITGAGSPFVFGLGFGNLSINLGFGFGDLSTTPSNAQTVGVVTPTGTSTSGTLSGVADVMPGLVVGSAASGSYTIDSTTGRGTGSISLTDEKTINGVFWVLDGGKFVVLDVQTADPDLIGIREQ